MPREYSEQLIKGKYIIVIWKVYMHICTQQGGRICWDCAENYGILPDTTL